MREVSRYSKLHTSCFCGVRLELETHAMYTYETCSCSNTDACARFRGIVNCTLRVSVVFDWNTRLMQCMKRVHVRILVHRSGFQVFLTMHIKFSLVFDWNSRGPIPKLVYPQTVFKPPSVTHLLIPLDS